ncbi:MAG: radical SAM protein [Spirochaetaceae bacterium]|nr:radical SAM protein [Spirochaetaceae bacterium]
MKESLCDDFLNSKKVLYPFFDIANQYLTGKTDFYPWAVEVHPTAKCNHSCIHCSYKERNENRIELDKGTFDKLIDSLIEMKVHGVFFSGGGEPCAYRYLKDAIVKLSSNGIEVALVTNGTLIEKMEILEVANYLNYIAVSVPSCNKEMFKKITGNDYVETVLELPRKIRDLHGEKSPIIGTRVVITNLIADEVPSILQTLKDKEFDYANFKVVRDYESRGLGLSDEMSEKLNNVITDLVNNGKIDHRYTNLDTIFNYRKPYEPKNTCHMNRMGLLAVVTPEGDVFHNISEIGNTDFLIGNLHYKDLKKLWNSPEHEKVKEASHNLWISGKCKNCRSIGFNQRINEVLENLPSKMDSLI